MTIKYLTGHVSEETAYIVEDYPYGFRLRCRKRYWLECKESKSAGIFPKYRLCTQTTNPKKENMDPEFSITGVHVWNKVKKSTYCDVAAFLYKDDEDHVKWSGFSMYSGADQATQWLEQHKNGLSAEMKHDLTVWFQMATIIADRKPKL